MRRSFRILIFSAIALVALDDDARTMTGTLFQDGYFLVAGHPTPIPLERPPFLAVADLHECLRGTGSPVSGGAFAEFCADLASFASPAAVAEETAEPVAVAQRAVLPMQRIKQPGRQDKNRDGNGDKDTMIGHAAARTDTPVPAPSIAEIATVAEPAELQCTIDGKGAASLRVDGVWMTSLPKYVGGSHDAKAGETSRIVAVPPRCEVQSPADGKVLYAGTFKGYLGVVILETGKVDRLTVAGLGNVAVARGDTVKRGSALGSTSASSAPALENTGAEGETTLLYVGGVDDMGEVAAASPAS